MRVLVRAFVWSLGNGMAVGIGGIMAVVTVVVMGTLIGEAEGSSSSDSWMMSLGLLVGL